MNDDHLYAIKCQAGNTEAFGVLYDRYVERIYRFIFYKTFSKETAEDISSDVFMKAFEKIHSFNIKRGTFSAWLYRIARNTVIDYYRTRKIALPFDEELDAPGDERTEEKFDALQALAHVSEYLKTLTPHQREIITLRVWQGYSYREIADIVGGTETSVKMAFSRSIRDVREKCGPFALTLFVLIGNMTMLPFSEIS